MFATTTSKSTPVLWQGTTQDGYILRLTHSGLTKIVSNLKQTGLHHLVQNNLNGSREAAIVRAIAKIAHHATRFRSGQDTQIFMAVGKTRKYQIVAQLLGSQHADIVSIRSLSKEMEWKQEFEHELEQALQEGEYEIGGRRRHGNPKGQGKSISRKSERRRTSPQPRRRPDISNFGLKGPVKVKLLREVHGSEFNNTLKQAGWREAPNAHILKRLKQRGPSVGINTLDDFARELRQGRTVPNPSGGSRRVLNITTSSGRKPFVVFRDDQTPGTFVTLTF